MKKHYYSLFAAATMMLAVTSCSQEEDFAPQSSSEMTTFSVQLESATQSRAVGEGENIDKLYYEVWSENGDNSIIAQTSVPVVNGKATVALPLMKHKMYDIIFWAQSSENSIYTLTNGLKSISVNYGENGIAGNNENNDAFFNALDNFEANGNEQTIELRRPFAQLNIGTSMTDWNEAARQLEANGGTKDEHGVDAITVTVNGLANSFNAMTGSATGNANATFLKSSLQEGKFVTNEKEYKYLGMNYLLVTGNKAPQGTGEHKADPKDESAKAKDNVDITFTLHNGEAQYCEVKVPSAPIQRNYRTNIIGDFLTGDNSIFEVTVNPTFDEPAYTTYDALLEVLEKGGTITLYSDMTLPESITVPVGKEAKIDLNGYELTVNSTNTVEGSLEFSNGKVVVDVNGEGETFLGFLAKEGSTVDFSSADVTVEENNYAVAVNGNDVTVNLDKTTMAGDGIFAYPSAFGAERYEDLTITLTESTIAGTNAIYLMFVDATVILDENSSAKTFVVAGGGTKVDVVYSGKKPEVQSDGTANTVTYYTKEKYSFMKVLEEGGEITLTSDLTLDETLVVPAGVEAKVNLGNKTLTVSTENKVEGSLKISNGTMVDGLSNFGIAFDAIGDGAKVEFENVQMNVSGANKYVVTVESESTNPDAAATINLNGTTISTENNAGGIFVVQYVKDLEINLTNGSKMTGDKAIFIENAENAVVYIDETSTVDKITAFYGNVTVICKNATKPTCEGTANFVVYGSQAEYEIADALTNGGDVTLSSDATLTTGMEVAQGVKAEIKLENNTLNIENRNIVNGELTISGGSVNVDIPHTENALQMAIVADNGSKVSLDNAIVAVERSNAAVVIFNTDYEYYNIRSVIELNETTLNVDSQGHGIYSPFGAEYVEINLVKSTIKGNTGIYLTDVKEAVITIDAESSVENIVVDGSTKATIKYAGETRPTVNGDLSNVTFEKL